MFVYVQVALQHKMEELASTRSHSVQKENQATSLEKSIRDRESDLVDLNMDIERVRCNYKMKIPFGTNQRDALFSPFLSPGDPLLIKVVVINRGLFSTSIRSRV